MTFFAHRSVCRGVLFKWDKICANDMFTLLIQQNTGKEGLIMKRANKLVSLLLALMMTLALMPVIAGAEEDGWWTQDAWDEETLLSLGAELPDYDPATGTYSISTPQQLLYLTGDWKTGDSNGDGAPDAPCNGFYVLTADLDLAEQNAAIGAAISKACGKKTEGYQPPIGAFADNKEEDGTKCAFFGEFDGQGHVIRNLRVERVGGKYCGLFGNIGHDYGEGSVHDLAILDATVISKASAGILAGAIYGDVYNVVVTGTLDVQEKTAGGIAGKIKKNDNGYIGYANNCFAYVDITVRGQGGENGAAGGITSASAGAVYNCFAAGSVTVFDTGADSVGGISGNLKAGQAVDNNVMMLRSISVEDGKNIGLLCGSYAGETGSHLHNNYVWEGTQLTGNVTSDHPETASYTVFTAADAQSRSFYADTVGWDMDNVWTWIGDETHGYPMIKAFAGAMPEDFLAKLDADLTVSEPVLRVTEPAVNSVFAGDPVTVAATVLLPDGTPFAGTGTILYGTDKDPAAFSGSAEMAVGDDGLLKGDIPVTDVCTLYYTINADIGGKTYTYPTQGSLRMDIVSASAKFAPEQLTVSPGAAPDAVGINFITSADGLTASVRYRVAGTDNWMEVPAEQYVATVGNGFGTFTSYSADLTGLTLGTEYDYLAVTNDGTADYLSARYSFKTLPAGDEFSFVLISDLQATAEEGYKPWLYTSQSFLADTLKPDFVVNLGDQTEDDTMAQWGYLFNTIGELYATTLTAYAPGNHESKGDVTYTNFKGRTNLAPGCPDEMLAEDTSAFTVGDVCFVTLCTEPYSGVAGADAEAERRAYYEAQKAWAKEVFEASGCKWRIICAHAGLVQDDDVATAFLEQMCEELGVALFFNGHIHNYYRATVDGSGNAAEVGDATTFITTSPMGLKFDPAPEGIDDLLQFQTGGEDDERQYLTYVHVKGDKIEVVAYQRATAADANAKNCADYTEIDRIELTYKESVKEEPAPAATAEPVSEGPAVVEEPAPAAAPKTGLGIGLIVGGVIIIGVVVFLILRKKKQA